MSDPHPHPTPTPTVPEPAKPWWRSGRFYRRLSIAGVAASLGVHLVLWLIAALVHVGFGHADAGGSGAAPIEFAVMTGLDLADPAQQTETTTPAVEDASAVETSLVDAARRALGERVGLGRRRDPRAQDGPGGGRGRDDRRQRRGPLAPVRRVGLGRGFFGLGPKVAGSCTSSTCRSPCPAGRSGCPTAPGVRMPTRPTPASR
ncbi:MAG: hypothetical protein R3B49_04070 [Phycisphaerales bacterium]